MRKPGNSIEEVNQGDLVVDIAVAQDNAGEVYAEIAISIDQGGQRIREQYQGDDKDSVHALGDQFSFL